MPAERTIVGTANKRRVVDNSQRVSYRRRVDINPKSRGGISETPAFESTDVPEVDPSNLAIVDSTENRPCKYP